MKSSDAMGYPFTETVRQLNRQGKRFVDMQTESNEARSAAWWNRISLGEWTSAPPRDRLDDIAKMFGVTKRRVQEMIAEEWYEVRPDDGVSDRDRHSMAALAELDDDEAALSGQVIHHMHRLTRGR